MSKLLISLLLSSSAIANDPSTHVFSAIDINLTALVECCEQNASCCVDFSESATLKEFKNQVKAIDTYQLRVKASEQRSKAIQDRLHGRQLHYEQRYNSIGIHSNQNK